MKSNTLSLEKLIIARNNAPLSAPISLELAGGEMLAIKGSNGSGKSTLLKTIAGLIPIHQGNIRYTSAEPPEQANPTGRGRAEVGASPHDIFPRPVYLGHARGLTPGMSVYDNVVFWARASGHPELTDAALHYFDLSDIPDAPVESLSAGWQQRVALTRLITLPSGLWLLDEPTANLDSEGTSLLQSLMQTRLEQGGIILVATHLDMQGDRIKALNLDEVSEATS